MAYSRNDPRRDWANAQEFVNIRRQNWMTAVKELQKEATHSPPEDFPGERKIATLDDAVETLGVGIGARRNLARKMIKEISEDTRRAYAIAKEATNSFDKYTIREIVSRGLKLSDQKRKSMDDNSDMFKADDGRAAALKQGYSPFASKKGGLRKPGKSGGFDYWYPGQGFSNEPHDEEHGDHHEDHDKATPSKEVAEAWSKVQDLAAQHGVKITNKGVFPNKKTTLDDIEEMKKRLNDTVEGNKGTADGKDDKDDDKPSSETDDSSEGTPDGDRDKDTDESSDSESGEDSDAASEDDPEDDNSEDSGLDSEFDPEKDLGFKLDDEGNPIGHDVPESPHEVEQLRAQVKDLMGIIEKLDEKLDEHQKEQSDRVRRQARQVHANPSPQAVFWLAKGVSTLLTIGGWATVGLLAGGPAGMILGYAFGHHINQQKRIAEASQAQHYQERSGGAARGELSRVDKHDHAEFMEHLQYRLKENDNADGSDIMTPRERLELLDHIDYTKWRRKNGVPLDKDEVAKITKSDVFIDLRTGLLLVKADSSEARQEQRAKLRPVRSKAQGKIDQRLDKLLANIEVERKPVYIPKKKSAGSDPADYSSWSEDEEKDDNKKMKKKRKAPPIKKSHLRARKPTNEHGHRDGLIPGQKLKLRRTHVMKGNDGFAIVAEDGRFTLGDQDYSNGHQLMKALYSKPDHKMTVRRYFKL